MSANVQCVTICPQIMVSSDRAWRVTKIQAKDDILTFEKQIHLIFSRLFFLAERIQVQLLNQFRHVAGSELHVSKCQKKSFNFDFSVTLPML